MTGPVRVPADEFADAAFWRRAESTAADRGHGGHPIMLVGQVDPTNVYLLRCPPCDVTVIEIAVDRDSAGTLAG